MNKDAVEKLLWSIALPGLGQLLNGRYIKGIIFILLEFFVNVLSRFNEVIIYSFHGNIKEAILQANYQWLMFYPCLYFFAMWDAYRDARNDESPFLFLPFVFAAYSVTVGLIYSTKIKIFGALIGPVFLPMLFTIPGLLVGIIIRKVLIRTIK
ncbi:hypothetical protein [Bacillus massilinigeriensis]|uniref:hypothetical protein n=1 Tax=Bacillus massilionigeriensis TaxID=1805475 RepID=UPI00096B1F87|nr:hypothetical protein [Bacillus massilionigeriensis]